MAADELDAFKGILSDRQLKWLRDDLNAYGHLLKKEPDKAGPLVRERMQHWQQDKGFVGMRGADALAELREVERSAWQQLWADVTDMLNRAKGKPAAEKKSDTK